MMRSPTDPAAPHEKIQGPGFLTDRNHTSERWDAFRRSAEEQERPGSAVVPDIRIAPIRLRLRIGRPEYLSIREAGTEAFDRFNPNGQIFELGPEQCADDRVSTKLLPPALGLTIVHHEVGVAQSARRAETQSPARNASVEHDRGIAEGGTRSPRWAFRQPGH